jgi:hypothetical protein
MPTTRFRFGAAVRGLKKVSFRFLLLFEIPLTGAFHEGASARRTDGTVNQLPGHSARSVDCTGRMASDSVHSERPCKSGDSAAGEPDKRTDRRREHNCFKDRTGHQEAMGAKASEGNLDMRRWERQRRGHAGNWLKYPLHHKPTNTFSHNPQSLSSEDKWHPRKTPLCHAENNHPQRFVRKRHNGLAHDMAVNFPGPTIASGRAIACGLSRRTAVGKPTRLSHLGGLTPPTIPRKDESGPAAA